MSAHRHHCPTLGSEQRSPTCRSPSALLATTGVRPRPLEGLASAHTNTRLRVTGPPTTVESSDWGTGPLPIGCIGGNPLRRARAQALTVLNPPFSGAETGRLLAHGERGGDIR